MRWWCNKLVSNQWPAAVLSSLSESFAVLQCHQRVRILIPACSISCLTVACIKNCLQFRRLLLVTGVLRNNTKATDAVWPFIIALRYFILLGINTECYYSKTFSVTHAGHSIGRRDIVMDYPCTKFGDCTFSCFGFITWTHTHTHTHRITDAAKYFTHATVDSVSKKRPEGCSEYCWRVFEVHFQTWFRHHYHALILGDVQPMFNALQC